MSASQVKAPRSGAVRFSAITTSSLATAVEIDRQKMGIYTFLSTVNVYLLFDSDSGVPTIDETETVDGELDIPWFLPADTEAHFYIDGSTRFFKHKGIAAGTLRFYKSGS